MNRLLVATLLLVALGAAAPVDRAWAVPLGESDGVRLVRSSGGELVFRFAPRAARAFRAIAGRKVEIVCIGVEPGNGGMQVISESGGSPVRVPRRGSRLRTFGADGSVTAVVRLSGAGRRMFIEWHPDDVVRTNILAYLQES